MGRIRQDEVNTVILEGAVLAAPLALPYPAETKLLPTPRV